MVPMKLLTALGASLVLNSLVCLPVKADDASSSPATINSTTEFGPLVDVEMTLFPDRRKPELPLVASCREYAKNFHSKEEMEKALIDLEWRYSSYKMAADLGRRIPAITTPLLALSGGLTWEVSVVAAGVAAAAEGIDMWGDSYRDSVKCLQQTLAEQARAETQPGASVSERAQKPAAGNSKATQMSGPPDAAQTRSAE